MLLNGVKLLGFSSPFSLRTIGARFHQMSTALVSLIQIRTDDSESPQVRYQRVIDQLSTIAQGTDGKKPDLIMLPEFWHGGAFNIEQSVSLATTFPGPISDDICDIAATHDVWIHAGSFV